MSSGEVTSTGSSAASPVDPGIVRAMSAGCRTRRLPAARIVVPLLLLCCLAPIVFGTASAAGEEYAPLWEKGMSGVVSSVAVTPDGSLIVAGAGTRVYLLDREGTVLWQMPAGSGVNGVAISPDGSHIGVAADKLYLYNREGDLIWTEKTGYVYWGVALSSNGTYVAAACDNGAVFIFDQDKKTLWDYDMGTDSYGIAISDNGRKIVVGCDNQGVYYLNSRDGESWSYGTGKAVKSVSLTPDGRFVVAGSLDRCVYLSTGEGEHLWKYPTENPVLGTALTNEANEVFAASGRTVHVIGRSGASLQKISIPGRAESVAVTPDGSLLLIGGGEGDRSLHLYTRDAALLESAGWEEETGSDETGGNVTAHAAPAGEEREPVAGPGAPVRDEERSAVSMVAGWVENVLSLLFKPQEGFIA